MSNNNKSNNNNNTCPLWNAWALKYCFISNHFASLGRVIWDPLQCTWKQGSVFCFHASSRFTIYSALKSQELKAIKIKRFSSLQRATQASATYQPFRQQLFFSPFYTLFHCSKLRGSTTCPEPGVCPPLPGEQGLLLQPQSVLPAPQIQEKCFIVLKTLSFSYQSVKIFSLSKSPVYRSWREMSTWRPLEASRSCFRRAKDLSGFDCEGLTIHTLTCFIFPPSVYYFRPVLAAACVSPPESWHTELLWFLIQVQLAAHTMLLKMN